MEYYLNFQILLLVFQKNSNPISERNLSSKEDVKKFKIGFVEKNSNFFKKLEDEFSKKVLIESRSVEEVTEKQINDYMNECK